MSSALRRVIPAGYKVCELVLVGESPLLMSSGEADRESDTYLAYRQLSKVRAKSLEQEAQLRELEWYTRLYFDAEIGPYIPGKNVKELLRSAATKQRRGEDIKRSLVIPDYRIPLVYDGPRLAEELWAEGFRYTTMVANAGAGSGRVERTRPCFERWSLRCQLAFDPDDLDLSLIEWVVERSQKYGLGDYRPEFGAFSATVTEVKARRGLTKANAAKKRDGLREAAERSMADRVMANGVPAA